MRRRGKLGVALLLALAAHALLLWRPVTAPMAATEAPGSEVIAVDWVAGPESSVSAPGARSPSAPSSLEGIGIKPAPTAAPPTSAAGPAPRAYADRVRRHLSHFAGDLPGAEAGEARVRFTVAPDGEVSAIELLRSSGDPQLDEAALALPEHSAPLPSPGPEPLRLEVPVRASVAADP